MNQSTGSLFLIQGVYKGKTIYYINSCRDCLPYCYDSFATKVVGLAPCDFGHMGFFIYPKGFTKRKPYAILKNMIKSLWTEANSATILNMFVTHLKNNNSCSFSVRKKLQVKKKRKPEK